MTLRPHFAARYGRLPWHQWSPPFPPGSIRSIGRLVDDLSLQPEKSVSQCFLWNRYSQVTLIASGSWLLLSNRNFDEFFLDPPKKNLQELGWIISTGILCEWWPNCCRICGFSENANINYLTNTSWGDQFHGSAAKIHPYPSRISPKSSNPSHWEPPDIKDLNNCPNVRSFFTTLDEKTAVSASKRHIQNQISLEFMAHEGLVFLQVNLHQLQSPWLLCSWGCLPKKIRRTEQPIHTLHSPDCSAHISDITWSPCTWSFVGETLKSDSSVNLLN